MTLLYYDPIFLEHDTGDHPECAARIVPAMQRMNRLENDGRCTRPDWEPISIEQLSRVHSLDYVESVQTLAAQGYGYIEPDTAVGRRSYEVARRAAGAARDAVRRIVGGEDKQAFCLIRPPGHHALADSAMGFCLFNNVAVASRVATTESGVDRVLIVDWDVHHGNGTQATFWSDAQVAFFSIHRWPFYPGTGSADETGSGDGLGATLNVPLPFGTPRADYLSRFATELEQFAAKIKPQLVIVSAGFDSHRMDPVGSLGLESEDFREQTRVVLDIAESYAGGRIVSVLEGGYHPQALAECVENHLDELLAHSSGDGR